MKATNPSAIGSGPFIVEDVDVYTEAKPTFCT